MIRTEQYNNISDELFAEIEMKQDEYRQFCFIGAEKRMPNSYGLAPTEVITDPFTRQPVEIAAINRIGRGGEPEFLQPTFTMRTFGRIACRWNIPAEQSMAEYLSMHPLNRSSPCRDDSREPIFYTQDLVAEAAKKRAGRRSILDAGMTARTMSLDDVRQMCEFLGRDTDKLSEEQMRDRVEEFAVTDPEGFLRAAESDALEFVALVAKAQRRKLIKWSSADKSFIWPDSGEVITAVPKVKDKNKYLADFLLNHERGDKIVKVLVKGLKEKA